MIYDKYASLFKKQQQMPDCLKIKKNLDSFKPSPRNTYNSFTVQTMSFTVQTYVLKFLTHSKIIIRFLLNIQAGIALGSQPKLT